MIDIDKIGAVILSAGCSSRQKGFKPLLSIGKQRVLEHCLDLFRHKGIINIVVVLGYRADDLFPVIQAAGVKAVYNPDYSQGMFSSVQAGVDALDSTIQAFFVLPVDIPLVRSLSIDFLLKALYQDKEVGVLVPSFRNKTGHPPLFRNHLRQKILDYDGSQGLRGVLKESKTSNVEVPDRHILVDIDTPKQYQQALGLWQRYSLPTPEEAEILLHWECQEKKEVIEHCQKVAQVAKEMAQAVNVASSYQIDSELVVVGALLHDIAKGQAKHAIAGAQRIIELGFSKTLADIVAGHVDYDPDPKVPVNETEIVYLADKLTDRTQSVSLDERFKYKSHLFKDNPEALQAVQRRWVQASTIYERFQQACAGG